MIFQDEILTLRISKEFSKRINKILNNTKYQDVYYNKSHFIRAAIIKEIRRCENNETK